MKKEERLQVAMTSPALSNHSEDYPKEWEGRVPLKVYMLETVRCKAQATKDDTYYCWVNRFGAVAAILEGGKLELKPDEFRVAEWQEYLLSSVNGTALGKCKLHREEKQRRIALTSPALTKRDPETYPKEWGDRVPLAVTMNVTIRSHVPGNKTVAYEGVAYYCWIDHDGELYVITEDGKMGICSGEFSIVEWHDTEKRDGLAREAAEWLELWNRLSGEIAAIIDLIEDDNQESANHFLIKLKKSVASGEMNDAFIKCINGHPRLESPRMVVSGVKEPPDTKPITGNADACITDKRDDREPPDILTGTGSGKGETSDVTVMDDVLPERCPQWQAYLFPSINKTILGKCKLHGEACIIGAGGKKLSWRECDTFKKHVKAWHDRTFPGKGDGSCNGMKEATGEPGEYINGRFGPDSKRPTCPFYSVIKGRCEVAGEGYHTSGICLGIERHDRGWWEHCSHYERAQRSRSASSDTDMKLDDSKDDAGKLRKRMDVLESLHASLTSNHNARLDEQKRQHEKLSGNYSKTMKDMEDRLAVLHGKTIAHKNMITSLSEATTERFGTVEKTLKDLQGRLAMPKDQAPTEEVDSGADLCPHFRDPEMIPNTGGTVIGTCDRADITCTEERALGWRTLNDGKPCFFSTLGTKKKEPSAADKPTWQGERCPFMGKRVVNDPEIFDCLLDAGKPSPKPCPGIFCENKAMWSTCPQLTYLCPHFRPPLKSNSPSNSLGGLRGNCACDGGECFLINARKWQDIDGAGTNCPRISERVKIEKEKKGE